MSFKPLIFLFFPLTLYFKFSKLQFQIIFFLLFRVQKQNTFLDLDDGLARTRLQVVIPTEMLPEQGKARTSEQVPWLTDYSDKVLFSIEGITNYGNY